jgi:site-specific DNA-methyltransferase (adenine-specific)
MTKIAKDFTGTTIIQGEALSTLRSFPDGVFGGIITDPPYSSGGLNLNARQQSTELKYSTNKKARSLPDFVGDYKDQRSWTGWASEWLKEARRCSKPGAPVCVFADWRQLPSLTDAIQWADWTWRGILVWDKVNSRPQRGRFRQQAEFIVWGSNGSMPKERNAPFMPGVIQETYTGGARRDHQTAKPLRLMREIVKIVEPGNIILDPFVGSGTTILAAKLEGYSAVGVEISDYYANAAMKRIERGIENAMGKY